MGTYVITATDGCDLYEASDVNLDGGVDGWGNEQYTRHIVGMITKNDESTPLLHFDFSEVGDGETITSAYLLLYVTLLHYTEGEEPENYSWQIYRCLRSAHNTDDWDTTVAKWSIYDTAKSWATPGCHGFSVDYTGTNGVTPTGPTASDVDNYFGIDVTGMTADAHAEDSILNIVMWGTQALVGESDICNWRFNSYTSPLAPKLIICTDGDALPSVFSDKVDASTDDAYEDAGDGDVTTGVDQVSVRSAIDAVYRRWGGFRFHNGSFPSKGSTIHEAFLVVKQEAANDDANLDVHAEDAAGGLTFTAGSGNYNITSRDRTDASVAWIQNDIVDGYWVSPGDIGSVLQEIATSHSLSSVVIILKPKTDATKYLDVDSYDKGALVSARLVCFWDEPVAGGSRNWGTVIGSKLGVDLPSLPRGWMRRWGILVPA